MSRDLPNIALKGGYAVGVDDWGPEMDDNLLKLSVLVQAGILGRVAAVPGSPAAGDAYVLTADPNNKTIAVYDNAAWVYFTPSEGWWIYDRGTNNYISFDGAAWGDFAGGGGGTGLPAGGTAGQVLTKIDGTDGNADWEDATGGGGSGTSSAIPAAPYWRIRMVAAVAGHGSDGLGFMEIKMLDASGTNLCAGGTPIASATDGSGYSIAGAFDGSTSGPSTNGWYSGGGTGVTDSQGPWVGYHFTAPVSPVQFSYARLNTYAWPHGRLVAYDYSYDGEVWQQLCVIDQRAMTTDGVFETYDLAPIVVGASSDLYRFGSFFITEPGASEVVMLHVATDAFLLPANLAGSVVNVGTNPSADAAFDMQLNGASIGTMTIASTGVVTFVTAGGAAVPVAVGDLIGLVAPADSLGAADVAYTFRGNGVAAGGSGKPWYWNPPSIADFAADSFGDTTQWVDDTDVGLIVASTNSMSVVNVKGQAVTAGTDWTCTMHLEGAMDAANYANMGMTFYNAAHSKFFLWTLDSRASAHFYRYNGGAFDGYEVLYTLAFAPTWLRAHYDHTTGHITTFYSGNGKVWTQMSDRDIKTDLGGDPAFVGPCTNTESGHTQTVGMAVDAWEVV